jgi:hypothetical protein
VSPILQVAGFLGAAIASTGSVLWIGRRIRRRRHARREADRVLQVARNFDVNPADADALAEIGLLGRPRNPARATTDRSAFDAGAALYLTQVLLEGGDLWGAVLALSRLRRRLGFEEAVDSAALAPFLGKVRIAPPDSEGGLDGVVVDRRGGLRVVVAELPDARVSRGDLVRISSPDGKTTATLRVFCVDPAGAGVSLSLGSPTRDAPQVRLPTTIPAVVRTMRDGDPEPPAEATILDLSHGGACVRLPRPAGEGERVRLSFEAGSPVEIEATVVWSGPAGEGHWRAGMRFGEMTEASRGAILSFLTPAETDEARSVATGVGS